MIENRVKQQLNKLKAEQKAKSKKRKSLESYIKDNSYRFQDKLNVVKITQKADTDLFANAIKALMKKK
tara:strand:+ start:236 stop:439 length:204 start_codon:yes stop_codon:yes gene_type:complete